MIKTLKKLNYSDLDDAIINHAYYIADSGLSPQELQQIYEYFCYLKNENLMRLSQIGTGLNKQEHTGIRNDVIFWIEDWQVNKGLMAYKKLLDKMLIELSQRFRLSLKRYESQIACYDPGAFYKKHYDQHAKTIHRQVSIILYLSEYQNGNGGELVLYPEGALKNPLKVTPEKGKIVIYASRGMLHEVLPTKQERVSITTWMRDDLIKL